MRRKSFLEHLHFWIVFYPFAFFAGLILLTLKVFGRIKVRGLENLPKRKKCWLIISPHQSMWEPAALYVILDPFYCLFHPSAIPYSTPKAEGLCDKWYYWFLFGPRSVPVSRNKVRGVKALYEVADLLDCGYNTIFFPEGTRKNKNQLGEFKDGVGLIICSSGCMVVPVAIDGMSDVWPNGTKFPRLWRKATITIGKCTQGVRVADPDRAQISAVTNLARRQVLAASDVTE